MSEETIIIAVSEKTFKKMSKKMIEYLKTEKIRVLLFAGAVLEQQSVGRSRISSKEEQELNKKAMEEFEKAICEKSKRSALAEVDENLKMFLKKQKYYVPRTIGKPVSKKRGGR